jgi:hypothetical protein
MKFKPLQLIGWLGAILILGAYFLVSFNFIYTNSLLFQGMNILGSLGIVIETFSKKDYQPMALNVAWILIAAVALVKLFI